MWYIYYSSAFPVGSWTVAGIPRAKRATDLSLKLSCICVGGEPLTVNAPCLRCNQTEMMVSVDTQAL